MATVAILSPVALGPEAHRPLRPKLATLRGRVLGIRVDQAWRSWGEFADEVRRAAPAVLGVRNVVLFDPGIRVGTPDVESEKVHAFARCVDAAVVGLGT